MPSKLQGAPADGQALNSARESRARTALYELGMAVARSRRPAEIYEAALQCLEEGLGVSRASVLIHDDQQVMRFVAWRNLSHTYRAAVDGHSPWAPGTFDPQPVLVEDTRADPDLAHLAPVLESERVRAVAFIPLTVDGELRGKFMLYFAEAHEFEPEEIGIAQSIAAHVGVALQHEASIRAVERSDRRYRELVQTLGVPIYTTDAEGRIELYNEAAVTLWGRRPVVNEEMWCGSFRLFHADGTDMPLSECPMAITLKEGRAVRGVEIIAERPDGTRANILPFPTPLRDKSGKLTGAVNVLADITEQKATQEALLEALRGKDDFLGQISHELRNPVTQIAGYAQLLASRWRDLPPETQEESLEGIQAQAI
ncbi:MAG: GAF domain-containing protein, partial [Tepidiformaceae bacterium]